MDVIKLAPGERWVDALPRIAAANERWRDRHLPELRTRSARQVEERARVAALIARGLDAIEASADERALVAKITGIAAPEVSA